MMEARPVTNNNVTEGSRGGRDLLPVLVVSYLHPETNLKEDSLFMETDRLHTPTLDHGNKIEISENLLIEN